MNNVYGVKRPAKITSDDVDIFYSYRASRAEDATDFKKLDHAPEKPESFDKMVELAKILSKDHYFLRVDFYDICGIKIP